MSDNESSSLNKNGSKSKDSKYFKGDKFPTFPKGVERMKIAKEHFETIKEDDDNQAEATAAFETTTLPNIKDDIQRPHFEDNEAPNDNSQQSHTTQPQQAKLSIVSGILKSNKRKQSRNKKKATSFTNINGSEDIQDQESVVNSDKFSLVDVYAKEFVNKIITNAKMNINKPKKIEPNTSIFHAHINKLPNKNPENNGDIESHDSFNEDTSTLSQRYDHKMMNMNPKNKKPKADLIIPKNKLDIAELKKSYLLPEDNVSKDSREEYQNSEIPLLKISDTTGIPDAIMAESIEHHEQEASQSILLNKPMERSESIDNSIMNKRYLELSNIQRTRRCTNESQDSLIIRKRYVNVDTKKSRNDIRTIEDIDHGGSVLQRDYKHPYTIKQMELQDKSSINTDHYVDNHDANNVLLPVHTAPVIPNNSFAKNRFAFSKYLSNDYEETEPRANTQEKPKLENTQNETYRREDSLINKKRYANCGKSEETDSQSKSENAKCSSVEMTSSEEMLFNRKRYVHAPTLDESISKCKF